MDNLPFSASAKSIDQFKSLRDEANAPAKSNAIPFEPCWLCNATGGGARSLDVAERSVPLHGPLQVRSCPQFDEAATQPYFSVLARPDARSDQRPAGLSGRAVRSGALIPIAIPQFGVVGSNWALPVVMLATAILGA